MRKAETTPKKLLLISVVPALVLGIVELATPEEIPVSAPISCVELEPVVPPVVAIEQPPEMAPEQGGCSACTVSL